MTGTNEGDNHHNALKCPSAEPEIRALAERLDEAWRLNAPLTIGLGDLKRAADKLRALISACKAALAERRSPSDSQGVRVDTERVVAQALEISKMLADAGIPACSLPEGVRMLIEQRDNAVFPLDQHNLNYKVFAEALTEVIWWMLGERDDLPPVPNDFPRRKYWWRAELRQRFEDAQRKATRTLPAAPAHPEQP